VRCLAAQAKSPSTSAVHQTEEEEEHNRADHCHDELAQEAGGGQPNEPKEETSQEGADDPNDQVPDQSEPTSFGELTGQPTCTEAYEQKPYQVRDVTVC
jgi:hypothetical protein